MDSAFYTYGKLTKNINWEKISEYFIYLIAQHSSKDQVLESFKICKKEYLAFCVQLKNPIF